MVITEAVEHTYVEELVLRIQEKVGKLPYDALRVHNATLRLQLSIFKPYFPSL